MAQRSFVALFALLAWGCADPDGVMEDFADRYARTHAQKDAGAGDAGACEDATAEQLGGDYLLSISPAFSPKTPILFLCRLDAEPTGESRLAVAMTLTPLSASDRTTPAGDALPVIPLDVPAGGAFVADLGELHIPGNADPVLPGSAIVGTVTLSGTLCGAEPTVSFLCGDASGNVTLPVAIGLAGSSWTLARVPASGELPDIAINCNLDPPDAL